MTKKFCRPVLKSVILPVVLLISFLLLSSLPVHADYLSIGNYQLVSSKRINSTVWQYTYTAEVTNTAASTAWATGVSATLTYPVPVLGVTQQQVSLNFGIVPGGETQRSTNTFTLNIDRRNPMPLSYLSWNISVTGWTCMIPPPPDTCHAYVFDTNLGCVLQNTNTAITLEPVVSPGGVPMVPALTRYVHSPLPGITVDLYYDTTCTVWNGFWVQDGEPAANYCGPTAGLNLLSWYGITSDYVTLGTEMDTNNWQSDLTGTEIEVCIPGCIIIGIPDPFCVAACVESLNAIPTGTRTDDMMNALVLNQPPGYMPQLSSDDPKSIDWFQQELMAGAPVIVLLSEGSWNLHWALVTGIGMDLGWVGEGATFRFANEIPMPASTGTAGNFYTAWSLSPVGGDLVQQVLSGVGINPYTAIWYQKVTELRAGQALLNGDTIKSQNGKYELSFWYGILSLTNSSGIIIWQSPSNAYTGSPADYRARMQDDGNFVLLTYPQGGNVIWATNTQGNGAFLALQDNGNLVIYNAMDQKLWESGTAGQ